MVHVHWNSAGFPHCCETSKQLSAQAYRRMMETHTQSICRLSY